MVNIVKKKKTKNIKNIKIFNKNKNIIYFFKYILY